MLFRSADHATHHPSHLPHTLQTAPVLDPAVSSQLLLVVATHKRLRGHIYVQSTYKLLAAVFEGVTERIYGRTFALKTLPRYQEIIAARSQPWLLPTPPSPSSAASPPPVAASAHPHASYASHAALASDGSTSRVASYSSPRLSLNPSPPQPPPSPPPLRPA